MTTQERHRLVIGTKCRYLTDPSCPNGLGLSRNHILWSLEQSLKRLKTDYIDLYQIHGWDAGTPLEDILRTLNDVVRSGKVRHIGASNLTGWQLQKFCDYAKFMGLEKMVTIQMHYNLLSRGIESEVRFCLPASDVLFLYQNFERINENGVGSVL
jgi:aryl-alcohol dehydrogenase-like predicted oxidoreductase